MKKKITRTIVTTSITALCLNTVNVEPFNLTVDLSGDLTATPEEKVLPLVSGHSTMPENCRAVQIVGRKVNQTIYAISEDDFIALAEKLSDEEVAKRLDRQAKQAEARKNNQ